MEPIRSQIGFGKLQGVIFATSTAFLAEVFWGFTFVPRAKSAAIGRFFVIFLALYIIYRFAVASLKAFKNNSTKNLITLNLVLIGSIALVWGGRFVALSLTTHLAKNSFLDALSVESMSFGIPFCTGIMILQVILGLQFAFIASVCLTLLTLFYFPGDPLLSIFVLSTCLVASLSLSSFRARSAYIKAGANVSLLSLPFGLAGFLIFPDLSAGDTVFRLAGSMVGGVFSAFLAAGLTPLFEYLGKYVTDMKLIESATLDHPLLKELSISAPGTWNHSMVMGMMVEAAADTVGANPILARVGAYFHDIGKMKKPLYFIENQGGGENRHEKLSSSMSALIIRSHVKDGIELAHKHSLPEILQDMIAQHHGTSTIEYFYDKALKEAKDAGLTFEEVDKSLYSYPGPKPQTKEAGILMLADNIEAIARTMSEHTADRIQGMVQKVINKIFASGQLDECELTLQDLHHIAKSFTRVLTGIYHQRIAYAEPVEKGKEKERDKDKDLAHQKEDLSKNQQNPSQQESVGNPGAQKKTSHSGEEPGGEKNSKEDLKRLGL